MDRPLLPSRIAGRLAGHALGHGTESPEERTESRVHLRLAGSDVESPCCGEADAARADPRGRERVGPADLLNPIRTPREYDAAHLTAAAPPCGPGGVRMDSFEGIAESLDADARAMFEEAISVLQSLRIDREAVEAKLKESGREDPIRTVTGSSALDQAIERTEALIRRLHGAVAD